MSAIDSGAVGGKKTTSTKTTTTKTTTPKTTTTKTTTASSTPKITVTAPKNNNLVANPLSGFSTISNLTNAAKVLNGSVYSQEAKAKAQDVVNNYGLSAGGSGYTKNATQLPTIAEAKEILAQQQAKEPTGGNYTSPDRQAIETLSTNGYYNQLLEYFKDKNEEARNSAISAIMQRLNTLKGMYGTQMDDLDEEYQNLINQNEVQRYKSKGAIREALANRGQLDSGLGRQEQLYLDTKYGNQTSNLKAQKQKAKQDIQNLINQAIAEAEADKAETNNAYNNALLQYELANA